MGRLPGFWVKNDFFLKAYNNMDVYDFQVCRKMR